MAESLFTTQLPALPNASDGHPYTLGTVIIPAAAGQVTHGRWLFPGALPSGPVDFVLYDATSQAQLARATFQAPSQGNWNTVALAAPVAVAAGQRLIAAVYTPDRYVATGGFFTTSGLTNGNLTAPATGSDPIGNGRFNDPADAYPGSTFGGNCFFVDIVFQASAVQGAAALSTVAALSAAGTLVRFGAVVLSAQGVLSAQALGATVIPGVLAAGGSTPALAATGSTPTLAAAGGQPVLTTTGTP